MKYMLLLVLLLLMNGCVTVISDQTRTLIDPKIKYEAVQANPDGYLGKHLLVGGKIITSASSNAISSMEIKQGVIDAEGVPIDLETSAGRFIAESTSYYDSSLYKPGSVVTLVGEVTGKRSQPSDGAPYLYPVLTIKEIFLWDAEKFASKKQVIDANPYSYTFDQPMSVRPLAPLINKQ